MIVREDVRLVENLNRHYQYITVKRNHPPTPNETSKYESEGQNTQETH